MKEGERGQRVFTMRGKGGRLGRKVGVKSTPWRLGGGG